MARWQVAIYDYTITQHKSTHYCKQAKLVFPLLFVWIQQDLRIREKARANEKTSRILCLVTFANGNKKRYTFHKQSSTFAKGNLKFIPFQTINKHCFLTKLSQNLFRRKNLIYSLNNLESSYEYERRYTLENCL